MQVYRLVKARHAAAALDGEGARRVGGRWNAPGNPVAYCASSLSLAVLELLVHVDPGDAPEDLVAVRIEIPEEVSARRLLLAELPDDWRRGTGKASLRALGTDWIQKGVEGVLIVPSVIVPAELKVLVNPRHPDSTRIKFLGQEPFRLDSRLF
jgi:RES domain-containing protein